MIRSLLLLVVVVGLALAWRAARPVSPPAPAAEVVLDAGEHLFRDEHEGGRVVAVIAARILAAEGGARLELRPSARGPLVEPIRGFRGVAGANHRTARELADLFDGGEIELRTRAWGREEAEVGSVRLGARGQLPERRVAADGSIVFDALSEERLPLELVLESGVLPSGRYTTEIVARERVRFAVDFAFDASGASILEMRGAARAQGLEQPE